VATGAYLSLTALFEKLTLTELIVPDYINDPSVGTHAGRARGPFVEAVANGLALYACAVAAAIAFASWRGPLLRALAACVAVLCLVGVQATVTRAVWLGAIVASVFVLIAAQQLRRYLVPALAVGLCLVVAAFALIPGLAGQAQQRQDDQSPVWERKNSTSAAFRMITAKPVVGFGWYDHNRESEPYFRMSPTFPLSGQVAGLHNLFLTYAVGLGLVGLGLWLLAVALALGGAVRHRAPPAIEPWRIGLGAIVACYIVAGIFGPLAYLYPTLLVWTWAGVAFQARARPAHRDHPDRQSWQAA
jgi:O-antigen ligase